MADKDRGTPDREPVQDLVAAPARLAVATLAGLGAGAAATLLGGWEIALLVAWDTAALAWVASIAVSTLGCDHQTTAARAVRDDPGRAVADTLLLCASIASLIAVGIVLTRAGSHHGRSEVALAGLGVVSVVVSWSVVHTVFALRYARLYYTGPDGGIDFNEKEPPNYCDFAYLAFTIGMTFQVSDTNIQTKAIRAHALRHALLSYVFGTVIVATTINLVSGLSK